MADKQPSNQYLKIDERKGQVTAAGGQLANYFLRNIPVWNTPVWQDAEFWRKFVAKQPVAILCRERIASYLNSLDWQITPRDAEQRDEQKLKIRYYTKLFEKGSSYYNDIDFSSHIEWLVKDLFELPFGTASEIGRQGDKPNGKVVWIRPLDGGTLAPTLNFEYPVVQQAAHTSLTPIYIPKEYVSRVYLSPRTELEREGWGYAPPERIYLAIEMLSRGDTYYAQLLLNTPEAGILDLGDMEQNNALEWVKSLRDLLYGISPLKIPVLYEHTTTAKFIPFGKPPSEIMYDSVTLKYAAILAAGYGLTLADIGLGGSGGVGSGGDTLAGTIRSERVSKSTGFSTAKKKISAYFNRILPDTLKFSWIDYDDERNVAKGRARLATAQASDIFVRNKIFSPRELRQQMLADGLIDIPVPEEAPEDEFTQEPNVPNSFGGSRTQTLGNPVAPSGGGQGEIIPQQVVQRNIAKAEVSLSKAAFNVNNIIKVLLTQVKKNLQENEVQLWSEYVDDCLVGRETADGKLAEVLQDVVGKASSTIENQACISELSKAIADKILLDGMTTEISRLSFEAQEKAEKDFIEGKSDAIETPEVNVDLGKHRVDLEKFTRSKFVELVSRHMVIIGKNEILNEKLDVDSTESTSENIKVSRDIAKEVLRNLSTIAKTVYETGREYLQEKLGEKDAVN